jgi:hypothetical protein
MRIQFWVIPVVFYFLAGCAALPALDAPVGSAPDTQGPSVPQLVTHIQCEVRQAFKPLDERTSFIVAANLTLDVTNSQSFSPVLNVITPLNPATTNRTTILGGQLGATQHRTMNLVFTLILDAKTQSLSHDCPSKAEGGLGGSLDLKEVVDSGLDSIKAFFLRQPADGNEVGNYKSASAIPSFGSTIDFSITKAAGGGPQYNLARFKGPSGSGNLLNFQRINKDTLIIAFAKTGPPSPIPEIFGLDEDRKRVFVDRDRAEREDQAARAAQDNITRMLLQRILPQLQ